MDEAEYETDKCNLLYLDDFRWRKRKEKSLETDRITKSK